MIKSKNDVIDFLNSKGAWGLFHGCPVFSFGYFDGKYEERCITYLICAYEGGWIVYDYGSGIWGEQWDISKGDGLSFDDMVSLVWNNRKHINYKLKFLNKNKNLFFWI